MPSFMPAILQFVAVLMLANKLPAIVQSSPGHQMAQARIN
jgi:hypothetical protein